MIIDAVGDGSKYGLEIIYSEEDTPLETGGGIKRALALLNNEPLLVISGDIYCEVNYNKLMQARLSGLAHLVLVENPEFHPTGDFILKHGKVLRGKVTPFNLGGVYVMRPELLDGYNGAFPIIQAIDAAVIKGKVTGEIYRGPWFNIGTKKEYDRANHYLKSKDAIPAVVVNK